MANTLTAHQATVVGMEALKVLKARTFMPKLVMNYFGEEAQTVGSSIKVPKIGALTANTKTAGADVTVQNATSTNATITLNKHDEATFVIEDFDTAISSGNLTKYYLDSALTAIVENVDAALTGLYSGVSTTIDAHTAAVTAANIRTARQTLSVAKAPNSDRVIVASPELYTGLLALSEFTSAEKYGSSTPVQEGELGKIYGFKVFESQSIVTATNNQNLAFHKRAFGIAVRPLPLTSMDGVIQQVVTDSESGLSVRVTMSYDTAQLGVKTTVDVLYGVAELQDNMAIVITS